MKGFEVIMVVRNKYAQVLLLMPILSMAPMRLCSAIGRVAENKGLSAFQKF